MSPSEIPRAARCSAGIDPWVISAGSSISDSTPPRLSAHTKISTVWSSAFEAASRPVCLYGHTHVAVAFRYSDSLDLIAGPGDTAGACIEFSPDARYLINPGSVGQPRDGDPRAGAAIIDDERRQIELFRLPYPIEEAQRKIRMAGLPEVLAKRLSLGR